MAEKVNKRGDRRGLGDHVRDTSKITDMARRYSEDVASYKAFVEERKARRKYTQEMAGQVYRSIQDYAKECYKNKQPLTVAGFQIAAGVLRDAWLKAKDGELDHLLEEFIQDNNIVENDNRILIDDDGLPWFHFEDDKKPPVLLLPWSSLRKNADLLIQDQLERNCYVNRGNPAGSIFGLKAQFQWQEDATAQHVVNQLVIADLDQAKKALQMLK